MSTPSRYFDFSVDVRKNRLKLEFLNLSVFVRYFSSRKIRMKFNV